MKETVIHTNDKRGKVVIAGAGPGDPDLITLKAIKALQQADVILTDRLVSDDILKQYAAEDAKVVYVGKQCRKGNSTPQETINELLVKYSQEGKLVVRLKGGDVSVFSNILDELQTLVANHIPYEIIPGITAASGAAAYAGIPLTARGYANSVRFLTFYQSDAIRQGYWKELAHTDDTLVFYMSSETLDELVDKLINAGIAPAKQIAVAEQATTPFQKIYSCTIDQYDETLKGKKFLSPSLVIIGGVVALHHQFGWIDDSNSTDYYFKPVAAMQKRIEEQNKPAKHVA